MQMACSTDCKGSPRIPHSSWTVDKLKEYTLIHSHSLLEIWTLTLAFYYIFNSKPVIDLYNLLCVHKYCLLYIIIITVIQCVLVHFLSSVNSWLYYV